MDQRVRPTNSPCTAPPDRTASAAQPWAPRSEPGGAVPDKHGGRRSLFCRFPGCAGARDVHARALLRASLPSGCRSSTKGPVHTVLNEAVWRGHLARNPVQLAKAPRVSEEEVEPYSVDEVQRLLRAADDRRSSARWAVALALGLRQDEALGLKWTDVDLDRGVLMVCRSRRRPRYAHGCADGCAVNHCSLAWPIQVVAAEQVQHAHRMTLNIAAWSEVITPVPAPDPPPSPSPVVQSTLETTSHDIIFGMIVVFGAGVAIVLFLTLASRWSAEEQARQLSEQVRALGGLLAVIGAVAAVILASVWAVGHFGNKTDSNVAILSAGFSAVTAITTSYLSIKAISNTAKSAMHHAQRDATQRPKG